MSKGISMALRIAAEVYRRNRLRIDKLQAHGALSAEDAKSERAAAAGAMVAALALDEGRGRGAPKGGRVVVGGEALTPARAVPYKKPRVKAGRGRVPKWREGFEQDVYAAANEIMVRDGIGVKDAINRLLDALVLRGDLLPEDVKPSKGTLRALYYRGRPGQDAE